MVNPRPLTREESLLYLQTILPRSVPLIEIYPNIPAWIQRQLGNVAVAEDDFQFLVSGIAAWIEAEVDYVITDMTKSVDRNPCCNPECNPQLDLLYLRVWLSLLAHNRNITGAYYAQMETILSNTHDSPDAAREASQQLAQLYVEDKTHQDENPYTTAQTDTD
jgi:hypothetical protein